MSKLMELADAYAEALRLQHVYADKKKADTARTAVLEAVEKLERDAARMDWLAKDGDIHVFFIADTWYSRTAYGQPYRKRLNLREAIDKAMEATNGQGN